MNGRLLAQIGALLLVVVVIGLPQAWADEHVVTLPVVVGLVDGANGTRWESRIRIVRTSDDPVRIRRVWVALPDGGFLDDPQTAPSWTLGVDSPAEVVLTLFGEDLLTGVESDIGGVQLAIDGGAHVLERIANNLDTLPPPIMFGTLTIRGPGQMVPSFPEPLRGGSFIPWANYPGWFRNNLGIVNPNDTPMEYSVSAIAVFRNDVREIAPPIAVPLPGYGFIQMNRVLLSFDWEDLTGLEQVFVITIEPEDERPYYAYGSMVYTDKNDPQLVAPVSGSVGILP